MKNGMSWLTFLDHAIADPESVTLDERKAAEDLANQWPTCACGELCKSLPRGTLGEPRDEELYRLGMQFIYAIDDRYWESAKRILLQIEARTSQLLKEMR